MDDLEIVLAYLQHQWLTPEVKDAVRRLERAPRLTLGQTGLGPALVPVAAGGRYVDLRGAIE